MSSATVNPLLKGLTLVLDPKQNLLNLYQNPTKAQLVNTIKYWDLNFL